MIAEHQKKFAETARPYEGCWFGTGVGKTRTCLWRAREGNKEPYWLLIVAPKTSVQKQQWYIEASRIGLPLPVVISKESFRRDYKELPRFRHVIIDEAHHVFGVSPNTRQRNKVVIPKASQLFEACLWYISNHKPETLTLATATPNKTPMSIWAAAKLLGHKIDFYAFRDEFYMRLPMENVVYAPKRDVNSMQKLGKITRDIGQVLRLEDIKDVPEQTFRTEEFELSQEQKAAIKSLPEKISDGGSLRLKQHQIENGVLYLDIFDPETGKVSRKTETFNNAKIDRILELADEFPKMVVFANYTAQVDMIASELRKNGHENVYELTGATNNRKEMCDEVERLDGAHIVAQASVSSEWEFKSCPVMVFASLSNKSVDHIQGIGRIQRYDAIKKNLYIYLVTEKGVDMKWYKTIKNGEDFNEAIYA
jgi:hypothetical protein